MLHHRPIMLFEYSSDVSHKLIQSEFLGITRLIEQNIFVWLQIKT